jgi:hypothetical protein
LTDEEVKQAMTRIVAAYQAKYGQPPNEWFMNQFDFALSMENQTEAQVMDDINSGRTAP